jgi:hypothetical protein
MNFEGAAVPERTTKQIQHEIEQIRDALTSIIDQFTTRTKLKRLTDDAKQSCQLLSLQAERTTR